MDLNPFYILQGEKNCTHVNNVVCIADAFSLSEVKGLSTAYTRATLLSIVNRWICVLGGVLVLFRVVLNKRTHLKGHINNKTGQIWIFLNTFLCIQVHL